MLWECAVLSESKLVLSITVSDPLMHLAASKGNTLVWAPGQKVKVGWGHGFRRPTFSRLKLSEGTMVQSLQNYPAVASADCPSPGGLVGTCLGAHIVPFLPCHLDSWTNYYSLPLQQLMTHILFPKSHFVFSLSRWELACWPCHFTSGVLREPNLTYYLL